jgi:phage regulator Rha-like protein
MSANRFDEMAKEWDSIPSVVAAATHAAEIVAQQINKMPTKPTSALEVRRKHEFNFVNARDADF